MKTRAKRERDTARRMVLDRHGVRLIPRSEIRVPAFVQVIRPAVIRTATHTMQVSR